MFLRRVTFAFIVAAAACAGARADTAARRVAPDLSRYEGRTVERVEVEIEEAAPGESAVAEFRALIRIAAGERFSVVAAREALIRLFDSRRVANARVEAAELAGTSGADGRPRITLRFFIRPQVLVAGVEFEVGVTEGTGVTEDELRSRLSLLEPGARVSEQSLANNADAIQVYLRDRGFYRATVEYERRLDAGRTRATIVFRVAPGPPTLVDEFNINIEGFDAAQLARIRPELRLQTDSPFTREALSADVARVREALITEGRLAPRLDEPRLQFDSERNRISVELRGVVGPQVTVEVMGYEGLSESRRRELLPVLREGSVDLSAIEEGRRRLRNRLQESGYFFADVTLRCTVVPPFAPPPVNGANGGEDPLGLSDEFGGCETINPEEATGRAINVVYEVERGRRYRLTDIRVTGTRRLSEDDIVDMKGDLRSQEANVLGIVPLLGYGRGYTSEDALEQDRRTIQSRMRELGYRRADVEVLQGVSPDVNDPRLIITFQITEGPLTRVAGIDIRGNQVFTAEEVSDQRCPREPLPDEVCLIVGGPFAPQAARSDGERIRYFYARQGYLESDVRLSLVELPASSTGDEQVRLIYTVTEADKVFVNRIFVNGLVNTKKQAVLDAIPLREATVLRADDLAESERVLVGQTGDAFRQVIIRTEEAGETDAGFKKRDVIIDVEERKRYVMDYGGGFSTDNGPLGLFEIRNSNLFGELKQGAMRLRASRRQQLLRFEYFDPRFRRYGAREFSPLTVSAQYQRDTSVTRFFRSTIDRGTQGIVQRFDAEGNLIDEFGRSVDEPSINRFQLNAETQRDLELELGPQGQVRKRSTIFLRYNYEDVRLFNIGSLLLAPILRPDQAVRLSRFGASFARDRRDRQFDPTRGDFLTVDYALALKPLGGNLTFSKLLTQYRRYYKVDRVRETVLAANVQLGLARIYNPPDRNDDGLVDEVDRRLPISERFFSGGSTTLRGFGFEEAGPRVVAPFCTFGTPPPPAPGQTPQPPCGTFFNEQGEAVGLDPFTVPIGGNAVAVVNLEARVGLTRNLQAVPFYDGGNVFRSARDIFRGGCGANVDPNLCAKWTHTVGVGARLKTPLGPLSVDYAYTLNPPEFIIPQANGTTAVHRLQRTRIHFRFGQTF
ncbi:MAG TPA: BamA/TamA family outer membrane protein [Pyrinomonadaceae bacterium]|nr:BamA/TamA family outer membrane protein [Pyrinomonadaceae bacterium]